MPAATLGNITLAVSITEPRMTSELLLIRIEYDYVVWAPHCTDSVVSKWLIWVEIENEESRAFLIDYQFVIFMTQSQVLMFCSHNP